MRAYKKSTCKQSLQIAYMLFYSITKRQLMSFLLFPVYNKILYLCIINHVFIKSISAVCDIAVDKREVCQPVFVRCSYVKKVVTRSVNIAYRYIVTNWHRHIVTLFGLIELSPRTYNKKTSATSAQIIKTYIFIMLRSVGAHLKPKHTVGIVECATAHNDVAVMKALASKRQAAMHLAISAILHHNIIVYASSG